MGGENGSFRSKLFGGFDRSDVIEYIEKSAKERQILQEENERLAEQLDDMQARLSASGEEDEHRIAQLETELEIERARSCEERETVLAEAERLAAELRRSYDELRADMEISLTQTRCELAKAGECADRLSSAMNSAGARLEELERSVSGMRKSADDEN